MNEEIKNLKDEVMLNRDRYHKLSQEVAVVKGRTEILEAKNHVCVQEEKIGKFEEFMATTKGLKVTLFAIAMAILLQVGTFIYLWGGLTTTVSKNNNQLWEKTVPLTTENTRNIDKILTKMDTIKEIRGIQGERGPRGDIGLMGAKGDKGDK